MLTNIFFQKTSSRLGNWEMQENGLMHPCDQCEYAAAEEEIPQHTRRVTITQVLHKISFAFQAVLDPIWIFYYNTTH